MVSLEALGGQIAWRLCRARGIYRESREGRRLSPHRRRFQEFLSELGGRPGMFYMFFTGGLLHYVLRALELVPAHVEVVLIGAALAPEEVRWIEENIARPFHHIPLRIDDNLAIELVFDSSRHDFGWMHIDTFVINPELFREMTNLAPGVSINCIWTTGSAGSHVIPHSAFLYVNHQAVAAVRGAGLPASPRSYDYRGSGVGRYCGYPAFSKVPGGREVRTLHALVPRGGNGLPVYPSGSSYYPLLAVFQLSAYSLGFRQHQVRSLVRSSAAASDQFSDEILHVNGVATYREIYRRYGEKDKSLPLVQHYPLLLQLDYAVLDTVADRLPEAYRSLRKELQGDLARLGLPPEAAARNVRGFMQQMGLSSETGDRIVGPLSTRAVGA